MSKRQNSRKRNRQAGKSRGKAGAADARVERAETAAHLLYGLLALFWLYAGLSTLASTTRLIESDQQELPWLIPAAVALFAVGWFLFHYVAVVAGRGQDRLAQGLLIVFFAIFIGSMVPVFLGQSELVREGARAYFSFGLAGLFLRMSTQERRSPGLLGRLFARGETG